MTEPTRLATVVQTKRGWIALGRTEIGLRHCAHSLDSCEDALVTLAGDWTVVEPAADPLLRRAADLVQAYFSGQQVVFDLPLDLSGLPTFTKRVLLACYRIPPGETRSYGQLAREVGNPRAARAVGQVMRRNPMGLIIPCHRVIGSDGSLIGFAGKSRALALKASLLALERVAAGRG